VQKYLFALGGLIIGLLIFPVYQHLAVDNKSPVQEAERQETSATAHQIESDIKDNPFALSDNASTPTPSNSSQPNIQRNPENLNRSYSSQQFPVGEATKDNLVASLQWLDTASTDSIKTEIDTIVQELITAENSALRYNADHSDVYLNTWLFALIEKWLATDTSGAINFILKAKTRFDDRPENYIVQGMAQQQLDNLARTNPDLLSDALSSIDSDVLANDHFLVSLQTKIDPDGALALFENADDPNVSLNVIFEYTRQMATVDPQGAIEWVNARSDLRPEMKSALMPEIYFMWADQEPQAVIDYVLSGNADITSPDVLHSAFSALGMKNPAEAMRLITQLPPEQTTSLRMSVLSNWIHTDKEASSAWLVQAIDSGDLDASRIEPYILAEMPLHTSLPIAQQMSDEKSEMAIFAIAQRFQSQGPEEFQRLVDALPDQRSRDAIATLQLGELAATDPINALNQLKSLSSNLQNMMVSTVVMQSEHNHPGVVEQWMTTNTIDDTLKFHIDSMLQHATVNPIFFQQFDTYSTDGQH